jgi:DNA-binding Lrp family transcriptional regulator
MDAIDSKILAELQKDARISYTDLAKKLNLSDVAIKKRVDKLIDDGIIKSFSIELNYKKLGKNVQAFLFLRVIPEEAAQIENSIKKIENTVRINKLLGQHDFFVEVVCNDLEELKKITEEKISTSKGVIEIRTYVVI